MHIQKESCDKYISETQNDVYWNQNTANKILNHLNKSESKTAKIQNIKVKEWEEYLITYKHFKI